MGKKISFNVNAYTARLIGRENVSTLDGAILELVKNTYDADANKCILYYDEIENALYLMDNGTGMTEEIIEKHWMTIGNSSKHTDYITRTGRIQTGAKGIGRFALDRVSDNCVMYTKNSLDDNIIEWKVNWNDFERVHNLTDVTADINYLNKNKLGDCISLNNKSLKNIMSKYFTKTGTIFKLTSLREVWNDDLINQIKKSLGSLIPPGIENEFSIYFFNKDTESEEKALVISESVDKYDYKIEFKVHENKEIEIFINRNEFDLGKNIDEIIIKAGFLPEDKEYFLGKKKIISTNIDSLLNYDIDDLGKFDGILYFNKIQTSKDDAKKYYYKDITGRKNYSKIFGGIKLYRDGFRVRPYGEIDSSGYDWLLLGARNNGSAAISHQTNRWKVSPEQITGVINISRININLPDQANRQGIVETKQFKALKDIIISIIAKFEDDRQDVGRKFAKLYEKEHPTKNIEDEINSKAQKSENNTKNTENTTIEAKKAKILMDKKDEEIKNLEDENKMLRNLATTGIISNQYIHETNQAVNNIGLTITTIWDLLEDNDVEKAIEFLGETEEYIKKLNSWFDVTIRSIRRDKRKMKFTDIGALVNEQIKIWKEVLKNQNIEINFTSDENLIEIKCFPYEIESIISNLISNSVYEFSGMENKIININMQNSKSGIVIHYEDNGPGLAKAYKNEPKKILEAFETNKRNSLNEKIGTGMGMWIINNIVNDYNGTIDLEKNKNVDKGFYIDIELNSLKKG